MKFCQDEHTWKVRSTAITPSRKLIIVTVGCLSCPEVIDLEVPITDIMKTEYITWKYSDTV